MEIGFIVYFLRVFFFGVMHADMSTCASVDTAK